MTAATDIEILHLRIAALFGCTCTTYIYDGLPKAAFIIMALGVLFHSILCIKMKLIASFLSTKLFSEFFTNVQSK